MKARSYGLVWVSTGFFFFGIFAEKVRSNVAWRIQNTFFEPKTLLRSDDFFFMCLFALVALIGIFIVVFAGRTTHRHKKMV